MSNVAARGGRPRPKLVAGAGGGGRPPSLNPIGGGGGGDDRVATEKWVELKMANLQTEMKAMEDRLDQRIKGLPNLWQIAGVVGTGVVAAVATTVAVIQISGDRYDGGYNAAAQASQDRAAVERVEQQNAEILKLLQEKKKR